MKPSWEDGQELVFNWTANKPSRKTPFFPLHTCPLSFCSAIPSHYALHSVPSVRQWPAQTLGSVCSGSSISSSPFRVMPGGPCSGMGFAIFLLIFSFSAGVFCPFYNRCFRGATNPSLAQSHQEAWLMCTAVACSE